MTELIRLRRRIPATRVGQGTETTRFPNLRSSSPLRLSRNALSGALFPKAHGDCRGLLEKQPKGNLT